MEARQPSKSVLKMSTVDLEHTFPTDGCYWTKKYNGYLYIYYIMF